MASPVKVYQKEMHDNLGFFATWLPGDRIALGEAGTLEGGRFRKQATLEELGITYRVSAPGQPQSLQYTSTSGTKIDFSAGADASLPVASAEIRVEFSREGAFLFQALNLRQTSIEDRLRLAAEIVRAYEKGVWQKEWYLIESLHVAECATVAVSQDSSAGLTISAQAGVPLGTLPLANPEAGLKTVSTRGTIVHVLAEANLRPLFSCLRLKDSWLRSPSVVPVRGRNLSQADAFARPTISELLDS